MTKIWQIKVRFLPAVEDHATCLGEFALLLLLLLSSFSILMMYFPSKSSAHLCILSNFTNFLVKSGDIFSHCTFVLFPNASAWYVQV